MDADFPLMKLYGGILSYEFNYGDVWWYSHLEYHAFSGPRAPRCLWVSGVFLLSFTDHKFVITSRILEPRFAGLESSDFCTRYPLWNKRLVEPQRRFPADYLREANWIMRSDDEWLNRARESRMWILLLEFLALRTYGRTSYSAHCTMYQVHLSSNFALCLNFLDLDLKRINKAGRIVLKFHELIKFLDFRFEAFPDC